MQDGNGRANANRFKRYTELAFQYHIAAVSLWITISEAPYLFNPCMFLARHTIELLIKGLIYRDCGIMSGKIVGKGNNKRSVDNAHDLSALWDVYLQEKQPSLLPVQKDLEKIGKALKTISEKDMDSTRYRYPETKNPVSNLVLEPIKIDKETYVAPDLSKQIPLLTISQNELNIITSGQKSLKHGRDVFDLIEDLFQLIEQ